MTSADANQVSAEVAVLQEQMRGAREEIGALQSDMKIVLSRLDRWDGAFKVIVVAFSVVQTILVGIAIAMAVKYLS